MSESVELEVRCCCNPQKLLGFVRLDSAGSISRGMIVHLPSGKAALEVERFSKLDEGRTYSCLALKSGHLSSSQLSDELGSFFRQATSAEKIRAANWPREQGDYRPVGYHEQESDRPALAGSA